MRYNGGYIMKKLIISLCLLFSLSLWAEQVIVGDYQNQIRLISSDSNSSRLELTLGSFERQEVLINNQSWYLPHLDKSGVTLEAGFPQVPVLAGSIIIPASSKMDLSVVHSEYIELEMPIAPSKGNLTRDIDPDSVPYSFGSFYNSSESYPSSAANLSEPFIIRDYRGITVRFQPFVYYPAQNITRVYTKLVVDVVSNGTDLTNAMRTQKQSFASEFRGIYQNLFLNFAEAKYPVLEEDGRILVIKNSMFDTAIIPWVDWKRQMGYTVDVVDVTVAGPSANSIKTYIQNQYDQNNGLKFVQLIGDAPQVPSLSSGGGGSDPSYGLLAGADSYPDIFVGRFSAQTVAELETQVQRSIYYERDLQADDDWLSRAMGIASNEGGGSQGDNGESDQQHMELIRTDLLGFGYTTVDQMYQTQGATATQVGNNVNNGRGFINYVGHGSDSSWVTTGFNINNVNALTNDFMLPVIVSVACVNGNFVSQTCFAEAWVRATNNGNPTGATTMYASTINQGWNPPMRAQDEITDLLIAEAKTTVGGLYFNGASKMIEVYGTSGASEYKCWTIFGDASLMMRSATPTVMTAEYNPVLLIGMSSLLVQTEANARLTLSADGQIYGKAIADAAGTALITLDILPDQPMNLTLTITAHNKITHLGTVEVLPAEGPYLIVTGVTVNNGIPANYGELVTVQVDMENVGNDPAQEVSVYIQTTDPYLSFTGEPELIDAIAANTTSSTTTGVTMQIASNAPDQYVANYTVVVSIADGEEFTSDQSITINAPALDWGYFQVEDSMGDNNGRIDPGETFLINIPFTNVGHAETPEITTTLIINGGDHLLNPITNDFDPLMINGSYSMANEVTLSSLVTPGTTIQIMAIASMGEYTVTNIYNVVVGILLENFESGFGNFPWNFTGGDWITTPGGYEGNFAAQSAAIGHNQATGLSITMTNPADGIVSFWKKMSSEANRDFMKFYINNQLKGSWSGIDEIWTQVSYMVAAGTNTYRWEYMKDSSTSAGSDCVWVDEVVFPADDINTGSPILTIVQTNLDFGNSDIGGEVILPFSFSNTGDANMIGTLQIPSPYSLDEESDPPLRFMNYVLPAGESMDLNIAFRPTEEGVFAGYLIVVSDDPNASSVNIPLMGSATPVSNQDNHSPAVTALQGNYPNPFNPNTTVRFALKESAHVKIEVFNILGQKVKTLVNNQMNSGNHNVAWNGLDDNKRPVASGVYFYKMQSGDYSNTRKMILMK